jgi:hypothetical protein
MLPGLSEAASAARATGAAGAGAGEGREDKEASPGSSSAMILLIEARISSIEGSGAWFGRLIVFQSYGSNWHHAKRAREVDSMSH